MTFYEWSLTKKITNTPRGDFLEDMRSDESAAQVPNTREGWEWHLQVCRACDGAKMAFRSLWGSYQRAVGSNQPAATGYVYFIRADDSLFKIGRTDHDPQKRLATLQTANAEALELYAYIPTPTPLQLEMELHKRFSGCRKAGEWFAVSPEQIDQVLAEQSRAISQWAPTSEGSAK